MVLSRKSPSARDVGSIITAASGATRKMTRVLTRRDIGVRIGRDANHYVAGMDEHGGLRRPEPTTWMEGSKETAQDKASLDSRHHPTRKESIG